MVFFNLINYIYLFFPRSGKHQHHHSHHKHSHHNHSHGTDRKAVRSHSSSNVLEPDHEKNSSNSNVAEQQQQSYQQNQQKRSAHPRKNSAEKPCHRHLQVTD